MNIQRRDRGIPDTGHQRARGQGRGRLTALLLLLALTGLAAPGMADVVHLKDGRTLEGQILERDDAAIKLKTDFGTIKLAWSKIDHIDAKATSEEVLAEKRAGIPDHNDTALFDLAMWARDEDLKKEMTALLEEVVAANPKHGLAHELLGHVKVEGVWLGAGEVEAHLAALEAKKREAGLVLYEGKWIPEADAMRKQGFVDVDGTWVPRRQAETAAAVRDLSELLEAPISGLQGEYVTVFSTWAETDAETLVWDLDAGVRHFLATLDLTPAEVARVTKWDIPVHLLPNRAAMRQFLESGFVDRYHIADSVKERHLDSDNFALYTPRPLMVFVSASAKTPMGNDEPRIKLTGLAAHHLGRTLLEQFMGGRRSPDWALVGLAAFYEGVINYHTTLSLASFADTTDADPWIKDWNSFPAWRDGLRDESEHHFLPELARVMRTAARDYDSQDAGMCWSVIRWMLTERRGELTAYLRLFDTEAALRREPLPRAHEAVWRRTFSEEVEKLEEVWRRWALGRPPRFPTEELTR